VIALGLALTLVAGGATVFAVIASATTSTTIPLSALGVSISVSPPNLFIAGALSMVLLAIGVRLISRGTLRSARTHKELKSLRKDKALATKEAADRRDVDATDISSGTSSDNSAQNGADGDKDTSPAQASAKDSDKDSDKGSDKNPARAAYPGTSTGTGTATSTSTSTSTDESTAGVTEKSTGAPLEQHGAADHVVL